MAEFQFSLLLPEFLVAGLAITVFTADLFLPESHKGKTGPLSIVGLVIISLFTLWHLDGVDEVLFGGLVKFDTYSLFFKEFFLFSGIIIIIISLQFVEKYLSQPGEYYAIILTSVLAMMFMASSGELLTAYISLELLSFCLYVLAGYSRVEPKSHEAGVKYILLGAFSSALLLYGISLLYGSLGTTSFSEMAQVIESNQSGLDGRLVLGLIFLIGGLAFKLSAIPFHMWAPDVYEGAPLPITAYIAVASKAAAFALVLRLFAEGLLPAAEQWKMVVAILATITMLGGNLVALAQSNVKRMLAYSSIGQVGYLLMGIAALSTLSANGLVFHLVGYAVTNLLAFGTIIGFYNTSKGEQINDFAGLATRSPFLAACLTAAFLSLAGLPFFAGFTTKFYLFAATAEGGFLWLVCVAGIASVISLYYYLQVIKQMYVHESNDLTEIPVSPAMKMVLLPLLVGVILIGVYPGPLVESIGLATLEIFPESAFSFSLGN